jgi:tetratricopeptide (TPR) repeat protein
MIHPTSSRHPIPFIGPFVGLLIFNLAACTAVPPYRPPTQQAPVSGEPEAATVEVNPATPEAEVGIPQPLPPANTRSYHLNAASRALVDQANVQRKGKNFMQAAATLERALRIEPNNPLLWLEYGELRMDEGNFAQAENMGRKAVASASGDVRTQANAWRLIAESLKARDKNNEAQQAYAKASALMGR